jgi:hypothetical protein
MLTGFFGVALERNPTAGPFGLIYPALIVFFKN